MARNLEYSLYRPCVGIALFNPEGLVFVGERLDTPGSWQMPQGGINLKEKIEKAAMRELREEIGTDKVEIVHVSDEKIRYDLPEDLRKKLWKGRYQGQEQTWIVARFTGDDADININAHEPAEFGNWKWVELEKTIDMIVPFKRPVYDKVVKMIRALEAF